MKCKFCNAELEENITVCPACGKSQEDPVEETAAQVAEEVQEEPVKKEKNKTHIWKVIMAVAGGVVLSAVLVFAVLYGLGIDLKPRPNDVHKKDSYTVSEKAALRKSDKVIATVGDQELTNGTLQIFYWDGVTQFLDYYGSYLGMLGFTSDSYFDTHIYDSTTNTTLEQMFLSNALETWRRYATLVQMAEDEDFTPTPAQQEDLDNLSQAMLEEAKRNGHDSVETYVKMSISGSATVENFYDYNKVNYLGLAYYDTIFDTMIPSTDDLEKYYTDHQADLEGTGKSKEDGDYYYVRHILIAPKGGTKGDDGTTTYSDAEWEACRAEAQKILDSYLKGEKTEAAFGELAKEKSEDPVSKDAGGLYSKLTKSTNFVTEFKDWYMDESRKSGDTDLVKSAHGYHIMYFCDSKPIWEEEVTTLFVFEKTNKMLEDAKLEWPMEVDYKKIALGYRDLNLSTILGLG